MTLGVSVADIVEKSNNPLLKIHPSWQRVLLGDIAEILNGFAFESSKFSKDKGYPLIRIRDIGDTKTQAFYTGDFDKAYIVKPGDLIIGMDGDFNCAKWAGEPALLNQRVCKVTIKSPDYNPNFLYYVLPGYLKAINDHTSSVTVKHLSSRTVSEIPLPFPPLPEQERIVAKIEELFTQLEAGTSALERVQAGLRRYKASVLKAGAEGKFENGSWESDELPEGWRWIKVKEAGKVQLGRQRAPKHHHGTHMRPYLRVANVFEDRIDLSDVKEMNFTPAEYEIYKLEYGDILLNEGQSPEYLGRPAMYKGELPGSCFQNTLIRFQAFDFVDRHFALLVFRHYMHAGRFAQESQITTNMAHLSAGRFGDVEFPLPPLEEQRRILAEVERRLSVAREVESVVEKALARAGRLRQAILKSAFEGKL